MKSILATRTGLGWSNEKNTRVRPKSCVPRGFATRRQRDDFCAPLSGQTKLVDTSHPVFVLLNRKHVTGTS